MVFLSFDHCMTPLTHASVSEGSSQIAPSWFSWALLKFDIERRGAGALRTKTWKWDFFFKVRTMFKEIKPCVIKLYPCNYSAQSTTWFKSLFQLLRRTLHQPLIPLKSQNGYVLCGYTCTTQISKFGPHFRKNLHSKWYPVLEIGQFPLIPRSRNLVNFNSCFWKVSNMDTLF